MEIHSTLQICVMYGGIVVSMAAFQAVDPGLILGHRSFLYLRHCINKLELCNMLKKTA